ncbi:MAG: AAA family ATPase [Pyrinomonadaceae bacterium MAG19_C2-C3]|nr:AAA family ATPase [Pyrinomonadaceae bacterium MAG19_C2-C3]
MNEPITFTMSVEEIVRHAGWKKTRQQAGRKITLARCPACGGGSNHDEGTFFVNNSRGDKYYGAYKCYRGKCAATGNHWQLFELAGLDPREFMEKTAHTRTSAQKKETKMETDFNWQRKESSAVARIVESENLRTEDKKYILPTEKLHPRSQAATDYLIKRGVSTATQDAYKICSDGSGNIAVPALEEIDGKLRRAMTKYRVAKDVKKGEIDITTGKPILKNWKDRKNASGEQVGKPLLIGTHLIDFSKDEIFIFEGEIKAMIGYEAIGYNCLSVPTGACAHDWIDTQWETLKAFDSVVVIGDNDDGGRAMVDVLIKRIPGKVKIANFDTAFNDITDLADAKGVAAVKLALESASFPDIGIVRMADYQRPVISDEVKKSAVASSWAELDRELGSLMPGHVTLLAGFTGGGKSKTAQNLSVSAMKKGLRVLYASFEETYVELQDSFENIMAGAAYLSEEADADSGKLIYRARLDIVPTIRNWYRDNFFAFAERRTSVTDFFKVLEIAVARHDVRFFVVDNIMSLCGIKGSLFEQISEQIQIARLAHDFAEHFGVHIILVAHNNLKGEFANTMKKPTLDSIKGSTEVTAWVQNVLQLWRIPQPVKDDAAAKLAKTPGIPELQNLVDSDASLSICKARGGAKFVDVYLSFDYKSMRFAPVSENDSLSKEWGWETGLPDDKYRGRRAVAKNATAVEPKPVAVVLPPAPVPVPVAAPAHAPESEGDALSDYFAGCEPYTSEPIPTPIIELDPAYPGF